MTAEDLIIERVYSHSDFNFKLVYKGQDQIGNLIFWKKNAFKEVDITTEVTIISGIEIIKKLNPCREKINNSCVVYGLVDENKNNAINNNILD